MNVLSTTRRAALIVALAASILAAVAGAASAGESQRIKTAGGTAVFDDLGELLVVSDDRGDYLGVLANLTWSNGTATVHASGKGKDQTKNLSIPEGETVWLVMCYYDRAGPVRCSKGRRGTA